MLSITQSCFGELLPIFTWGKLPVSGLLVLYKVVLLTCQFCQFNSRMKVLE